MFAILTGIRCRIYETAYQARPFGARVAVALPLFRARIVGGRDPVISGRVSLDVQAEEPVGVGVADVTDDRADQLVAVWKGPTLHVVSEQVREDAAEIFVPREDMNERESVSIPINREIKPQLERAFICQVMASV